MLVLKGEYFRKVEDLLLQIEFLVRPIERAAQQEKPANALAQYLEAIRTPEQVKNPLNPLAFALGKPIPAKEPEPDSSVSLSLYLFDKINGLTAGAKALKFSRMMSRLGHLREYVAEARERIEKWEDPHIVSEMVVLRQAFRDDLEEQKLFSPDQEKAKKYKQVAAFGETVSQAFPDASEDIADAGNCYATDNDTACVFHCMRVAEYGLQALAKHLKLKKQKAEWGPTIRDLRKRIEELNQSGKKQLTPRREQRLNFYSEAIDQCVYFKNLWRDDVSHTRGYYDSADAKRALERVEEFMKLLAKNGLKLPMYIPT